MEKIMTSQRFQAFGRCDNVQVLERILGFLFKENQLWHLQVCLTPLDLAGSSECSDGRASNAEFDAYA